MRRLPNLQVLQILKTRPVFVRFGGVATVSTTLDGSKPISLEEFRRSLAEAVTTVQHQHKQLVVERYGKKAVVVISIDDYERFLALQDAAREGQREETPIGAASVA